MSSDGSVTSWMHQLAAGDTQAANGLWQRYVERLLRLARKHLRDHPRRASDEEDVVVSVFHVFCQGAMQGRFPELHDRDNLWRLLVVMTARKAADHAKYEGRRRALQPLADDLHVVAQVVGDEPTPEFAALVAEACEQLLDQLEDDTLRRIAVLKLEGYMQQEIADQLGCSLRTVERKLQRIRVAWGDSVGLTD